MEYSSILYMKIKPDDPNLIQLFLNHCKQGWSPNMFSSKLHHDTRTYAMLKRTNPDFKRIHDMYLQTDRRRRNTLYAKFTHDFILPIEPDYFDEAPPTLKSQDVAAQEMENRAFPTMKSIPAVPEPKRNDTKSVDKSLPILVSGQMNLKRS